MANSPQRGARSATGRTRHGLGWVPWVALLVLLALIVGAVLLALNANDDNDEPGVDLDDDSAAPAVLAPHSSAVLVELPSPHQFTLTTIGGSR
jgi:hypothetical protein